MIRKLEQVKMGMPSSFFLFGERGIGKTALAKLLKHIAESKDTMFGNLNFLTSYYTAEKGQTIGSVLQSSLNELTDRLPKTALEVLSTKLGAVFKNGKFSIGPFSLEMASQPTPEVVTILKDQIVSILSNIFISLKSSENQTNEKDGVLIIIDEMQNVSDLSLCAQLLRGIITTLDVKEMGLISFLLIGYDDAAFFEGDLSARRQFDTICLEVMSLEEAGEAMTKGFQAAGVGHDEHELRKNIIATGGYPHAIQLLAHNLLEEDNNDFIGQDDWNIALLRTALELQKKDFADMYHFETKPTVKESLLDVLAAVGKPLSKTELAEKSGVKNVYQYLPDLRKQGSIKQSQDGAKIELHSQLFRTSILLKILPRISEEGYLKNFIEEEFHSEIAK